VRSAARFGSLKPYCVFSGDNSSAIHRWLVEQNVAVITHEAVWRDEFIAKAKAAGATKNVRHSHLYATPETMVSTFMRVDLPVIPELDQYTYILYTDTDVYFRRPVTLDSLGLPLPRSVAMSYEMVNSFPYNAGILVAHLPEMRQLWVWVWLWEAHATG
jgi:hypothetical protein